LAKDGSEGVKSGITVAKLCGKPDMSRQNYYKGRAERRRREADFGLAGQLVLAQRAVQPRLGGRKLFHILKPALAEVGVRIGRDRFFEVLKEKRLLPGRLPGAPKTTNSRHSLPVFLYNTKRPHPALNYETPEKTHRRGAA
jgi:transposase InsO family protein